MIDSERVKTAKKMLQGVKQEYFKFTEGDLVFDKISEVVPISCKRDKEVDNYFISVTRGLEGLMKVLSYSVFVEEDLKSD